MYERFVKENVYNDTYEFLKGVESMGQENLEKKLAGEEAVKYVEDGMVLGLGTGSTVFYTIKKLAQVIKEKQWTITAVSTSHATTELAESLGIKISSLNDVPSIDLTIDGADEVDGDFQGIKGGGGALLFEKIVATASKRNIWVVDSRKKVDTLGQFPLPVEVLPFGHAHTLRKMEEAGLNPKIRMKDGQLYYTDSQNLIFDLHLNQIKDTASLGAWLNSMPGVIEHGLFIEIVDKVIVAKEEEVRTYDRP